MNHFRYKMMDASGQVVSGVVILPYEDIVSVISYLEEEGNITIFVKKMGMVSSFFFRLFKGGSRRKVDRKFLAEWVNNLAMMIQSGMPLVMALEESADGSGRPDFKNNIHQMVMSIKRGSSFSGAVSRQERLFPNTVMHLIRIGEESGTLDERLKDAAEHIVRIQTIISHTKQALLYPAFVLASMTGGLVFWLYYVVPKIVSLFEDMDVELPFLTIAVITVSDFVQTYILEMGVAVFLLIAGTGLLYKHVKWFKTSVDKILLKVPVAGPLIQSSNLAFITEYFSLLLNAGVDIIQSVKILQESVGNEVFSARLDEIRNNLKAGSGISDSFIRAQIFPKFICRMINIGEKSGTLPHQLTYIANHYKEKLADFVANLSKVIEPVVLVVAGGIFAVIMAGLFLPIYDLVANMSTM